MSPTFPTVNNIIHGLNVPYATFKLGIQIYLNFFQSAGLSKMLPAINLNLANFQVKKNDKTPILFDVHRLHVRGLNSTKSNYELKQMSQ